MFMYNVIVFLCILTASYKQLQNTGSYPGYFVQGGSEDAIFIYVNGLDLLSGNIVPPTLRPLPVIQPQLAAVL